MTNVKTKRYKLPANFGKMKAKAKCPACKKMTYIKSVFGSICRNENCFYEPTKHDTGIECKVKDCPDLKSACCGVKLKIESNMTPEHLTCSKCGK